MSAEHTQTKTEWLLPAYRKIAILFCKWCGYVECMCEEEGRCPICDEPMGEFCCMTCGLTWDLYSDVWDDNKRTFVRRV